MLTDTALRQAKPPTAATKITDGKGLYILHKPSGSMLWRHDYRFAGKRKTLSLGTYPEVSLKTAREKLAEAKELIRQGVDPSEQRKLEKLGVVRKHENTFEAIAREWYALKKPQWAESHASKIIRRLEMYVFPWMGSRPIADITTPELIKALERTLSTAGIDTAQRVKQNCGQIFRYATQRGLVPFNIAADMRDTLPSRGKKQHYPTLLEPEAIGELLRRMEAYKGNFTVKCALRLLPLLFVRPGELRHARWEDIDLQDREWRFVASKTKTDHIVPLSHQAVSILQELKPLTGNFEFVFAGQNPRKPISDGTINKAIRTMGYDTKSDITGHGFRAMARTILHEKLGTSSEAIEHQLAHRVPDALGTAYNRTLFLEQRKTMMQTWADYLEKQEKANG